MKYVVKYTNPNNIVLVGKVYTYETRRKSELDKWLENAHKYSGSCDIISIEKVSEAKKSLQ